MNISNIDYYENLETNIDPKTCSMEIVKINVKDWDNPLELVRLIHEDGIYPGYIFRNVRD